MYFAAQRLLETYNVSMTVFLKGIIEGSIQCSLLPKGFPGEKGIAWEVWPYGMTDAT